MTKAQPKREITPTLRLAKLSEAASAYPLSVDTLRRRIAAGELTRYRLGPKLVYVDLDELERLFVGPS